MKYGLMIAGAITVALVTSACGSDGIDTDTPTSSSGGGKGGEGGVGGAGGEGQGGAGGKGGEGQGGEGGKGGEGQGGEGGKGGMGQGGEGGKGGMGGAGGMGMGGAGGAGGMPDCIKCGAVLMGGDPNNLCPESQKLAMDAQQCICVDNCAMECMASCTMGGQPDQACQTCAQTKCLTQVLACINDV